MTLQCGTCILVIQMVMYSPVPLTDCTINSTLAYPLSVTTWDVHADKWSLYTSISMSSRRKRGTLSITESILHSLKEGPELKTHVAYKSKIDSRTIEKYLSFLTSLHLVKPTTSGKYAITRKGIEFLKHYAKLKTYGVMDESTS